MVYIRIDVNRQIGMGHLMRCLSIADALYSLGESVTFITADRKGREIVEERGYPMVCIDDLNQFIYPCDCLICYANYSEKFEYPKYYKNTKLLLGTSYAPLRKEYSNQKQKVINLFGKRIVFLSAGADNYGVTIVFL